MLNRERFLTLLEKYTSDNISTEDRSDFLAAVASGFYDDLLLEHIENNLQSGGTDVTVANLPPHRSAEILHKILSSEKQNALLIPRLPAKIKFFRWAAAAMLIGVITFSAYFINRHTSDSLKLSLEKDMREMINSSDRPLKIEMEDRSVITLQPGSYIHYPTRFLPDKREIFLEGEAFFEVSKNAARPFFVYYKNIVTHVLGTSFNIKLNKETRQVEVSVRSGKVEVYENKLAEKSPERKKNNGVILLPNQKVAYDEDSRQFVPSLADNPLPIVDEMADHKNTDVSFVFQAAPLRQVLDALAKSYGIEIMVEEEDIYKCLFTGDLSRQDLYTSLDIICQVVQAAYEVKGTKILIKGKGCNRP